MESSQHRGDSLSATTALMQENILTALQNELQQAELDTPTIAACTTASLNSTDCQVRPKQLEAVYGNNYITVNMIDNNEPINEAVEEIYCEGVECSNDDIKCPSPAASPSQVYLNVDCCSDEEDDDLNFDPITKFLTPKRPLVSPLAKSPAPSIHSATSDHGYESIMGSPNAVNSLTDDFAAWSESFNEMDLFPNLI